MRKYQGGGSGDGSSQHHDRLDMSSVTNVTLTQLDNSDPSAIVYTPMSIGERAGVVVFETAVAMPTLTAAQVRTLIETLRP